MRRRSSEDLGKVFLGKGISLEIFNGCGNHSYQFFILFKLLKAFYFSIGSLSFMINIHMGISLKNDVLFRVSEFMTPAVRLYVI